MKLQFNHLKSINVIFLSVIMISLPLLSFIPISTASETTLIDKFGDGTTQKIIVFDSASSPIYNNEAYFTIPNNQTVVNATFEIDGFAKQGSYPANLTLDVGNDGDTDWQFKGEGYGPLGRQKVFLNNQTTRTITFTQPFSTDTSTKLRLLKNAYVNSANMKVTGYEAPAFPQTVVIDVENQIIFNYPDELDTTYVTSDFSNQLNNILAAAPTATFTDRFGNSFLDINMSVYCQTTGIVKLHDLKISYSYSSKVDLNNHNVNLAAELTEHIPHQEGGSTNIALAFKSDTVGKLWMKNVYILYRNRDEPPTLNQNIPDLHVDEGKKEKKIDLSEYFYDDRAKPEDLTYEILDHTEMNVSLAIVDKSWLEVDATKTQHWFGSFTEIIKVTDLVNNVRESNEFTIYIDPVNDEPVFNKKIQNITVDEDSTSEDIDLSAQDYFTDVENNKLYYTMEIDPENIFSGEAALSIDYNSVTSVFTVTALSDWFGDDVPVWIYCDDDAVVNTLSDLDYVYQVIYVDVTPVNDGPYWLKNIEDAHINEDEDIDNWINLEDYINDIDNTKDELSYGIFEQTNPDNIKVTIDSNHYIDIKTLTRDYIGSSTVTVEITDDGYQLMDTFDVIIDPVDDIPVINITSHNDGAVFNGTVTIHGTATDDKDPGGVIFRVESQISNNTFIGSWEDTGGTYLWEYVWYTEEYSDGDYKFSVKAYDGALYSKVITYNFTIQNEGVIIDPGKEESEALAVNIMEPDNNAVLQDEVVIKGNAAIINGEGDITIIDKVYVRFVGEGSSPWFEATGTSYWEYTWNTLDFSNGDCEIVVMAVSGDFQSPKMTLNVELDNPEDPPDPMNGNGNGNGITTIIDKTGDNFWLLLIFLLILFILAENAVISMVWRKRRGESEEESGKDERVEPPETEEPAAKPKAKPEKESIAIATASTAMIAKDKAAPSLTSEFPLDQTYRPSAEQLEVIPIAPHKKVEKPKFKVHFCQHCKKPFKIQLPLKTKEKIMCPWCNQKNIFGDKPQPTKPPSPPLLTTPTPKPAPAFKKPAVVAKPVTPTAKPKPASAPPTVKPAIKRPTVMARPKLSPAPKK